MEISQKTKKELQDFLLNNIENIKRSNLFVYIFCILKNHLDFLYDVNLIVSYKKNLPAFFDTECQKIYINPDSFYKYSIDKARNIDANFNIKNNNGILKYVYVLVMIHEVTHAYQYACATSSYSKYSEINKLYNDLYNSYNLFYVINYHFKAVDFFHERNANLQAFSCLIDIVPDNFKEVMEVNYLFNYLYNFEGPKNTPVRKTYKMIHKKFNIDSLSIPIYDKLMHGLDLSEQEYMNYIKYFYDGKFNHDYFEELNKRLLMR